MVVSTSTSSGSVKFVLVAVCYHKTRDYGSRQGGVWVVRLFQLFRSLEMVLWRFYRIVSYSGTFWADM
jgi:hypothetical protein